MSAANPKFDNIDHYISTFPKDVQKILEKIRAVIHEVVGKGEEVISYDIAAIKFNGSSLYFAGWKNHISLYPYSTEMAKTIKGIEKYSASKGTLKFPLDKPIPYDIIRQVAQFKLNENNGYTSKL